MARTWRKVVARLRSPAPATVAVSDRTGAVSGGGRIISPVGAHVRDRTLTGEAGFGFVCSHLKGEATPHGVTELRFPAAFLSFSATSHDWLVVVGERAMFEGTGNLNGQPGYSFLVTAEEGGGDGDRLGFTIWETATGDVVYDSRPAARATTATTPLTSGSIVVYGT